jgi:hypothetical protein
MFVTDRWEKAGSALSKATYTLDCAGRAVSDVKLICMGEGNTDQETPWKMAINSNLLAFSASLLASIYWRQATTDYPMVMRDNSASGGGEYVNCLWRDDLIAFT